MLRCSVTGSSTRRLLLSLNTPKPSQYNTLCVTRKRSFTNAASSAGCLPEGNELWMKNPDHPQLHQFLKREKAYLSQMIRKPRFRSIERAFYLELRRRLPQEDATIPECIGSYEYYMRQQPGDNFPVYYRRRREGFPGSREEEIVLDQNKNPMLHQDFHFIVAMKISPDEKTMLLVQENAHEEYRVVLRQFGSGPRFPIHIGSSMTENHEQLRVLDHLGQVRNVEWCNNQAFYFTSIDQQRRPHAVFRYDLQTQQLDKVFDEPDEAIFVDVSSTKDNAFVLINCNSKHSSEIHALRCGEELTPPVLLRAREQGTSYFADHTAGQFFLVTNADQAVNYKIAVCDDPPDHAHWRTLLPESNDVKIEDVDLFEKFLVIYERVQSVPRIRVCRLWQNQDHDSVREIHVVSLPDEHALCRITPGVNREYTSNRLRFSIATPLVPEIVYDYNLDTHELTVLKETRILDDPTKTKSNKKPAARSRPKKDPLVLDVDQFTCRREFVTSHDGVQVPLTLLHRRDLDVRNARNPTLLVGYGAYGTNLEADFELEHLSLLERGWIIAMAHVRGGGELGLRWYHDGKQLKKMNTFRDFEACTNHLLDRQYTTPARLAGKGTSAGGLIMGYMANTHPELFRAMILKVPFVDILETMQDPTLPLTVHEYDEWGNPSDPKVFQYIQQYSPCANMDPSATYPSMLVTGSMNDIRVQFWEPVKWVHRLRRFHAAQQTAANSDGYKSPLFLLRMSEDDGHFGGGGRLEQLQEAAMEYAFLYQALRLPFDE